MYYKGMPFNKFSLITNVDKESAYFEQKEIQLANTSFTIYERITDRKVVYVIYETSKISFEDIVKYHESIYSTIPCQTLTRIEEKIFKITTIKNNCIKGYEIIQYDSMWRDSILQILDENQLLLEYHKIYYNGDERTFAKEKIFYADSYHISEENYN